MIEQVLIAVAIGIEEYQILVFLHLDAIGYWLCREGSIALLYEELAGVIKGPAYEEVGEAIFIHVGCGHEGTQLRILLWQ